MLGTRLEEFIQKLPKTDLVSPHAPRNPNVSIRRKLCDVFTPNQSFHTQHVHLDGSPRISTLIELAQTHGVALPAYTEAGLREKVGGVALLVP